MCYLMLGRLANYWTVNGKPSPDEKDLVNNPEIMGFLQELCKLCYDITSTDQVMVTAVVDRDDDSNSASATSLAAAAIGPAPSLAAEEAGVEPDDEITNILLRHERINK